MLSQLSAWWRHKRTAQIQARRAIDEALWRSTLAQLPFLQHLSEPDLAHLRLLCSLFLEAKEFSGAQGLQISDAHAVMVTAQACLPILRIAPRDQPQQALTWYGGFVGIVLYPGEVRARREWVDEAGVAHEGYEELSGEAQEAGPLVLAWSEVQGAGALAGDAYNLVIHEFVHVMDMQSGAADACPPMPAARRTRWREVMHREYHQFCEACQLWERFGGMRGHGHSQPLLDAYGCESVVEFFAVAAEAYFVQRDAFVRQHPALAEQFDQFFFAN